MRKEISAVLDESSIYTLRSFANFIGVQNSTGVTKSVLIDTIVEYMDTPLQDSETKKGRKHMTGLSGLLDRLSEFDEFKPHKDKFDEYYQLEEKSAEIYNNYQANIFGKKDNMSNSHVDFDMDNPLAMIDYIQNPPRIIDAKTADNTPLDSTSFVAIADIGGGNSTVSVGNPTVDSRVQMECEGLLEVMPGKNFGFIRTDAYDIYISGALIQKMCLKAGDIVKALYSERGPGKYAAFYIKGVNRKSVDDAFKRVGFENLQATFPTEKFNLVSNDNAVRAIDLFAPIGKGQRALIVSPPKSGKTTIIKNLAKAIKAGDPETTIFILLIDERPEEVTDMQLANCGEVVFSAYDDKPERHIKIASTLLERAKRLVESGEHVCILMDSLTRFARALNMSSVGSGRSLSGGMDANALQTVKTFFGSGRNIVDGGSLTLIATALVDTNSRMDDLIFEEFKGTGNSEVVLDRTLSEKRIFPAIDIAKSGTRRDELLYGEDDYKSISMLRKYLSSKAKSPMENVIDLFDKVENNQDLLKKLPAWFSSIANKRNS